MYHVALTSGGCAFRTTFSSEDSFKQWFEGVMLDDSKRKIKDVYDICYRGFSERECRQVVDNDYAFLQYIS